MTKRIAIVGANGQVGSEVCLLLGLMNGVEAIPVCRTEIGSAFLRRLGLAVRHGCASEPKDARRVLEGADLVADFTLPTGSASDVQATMRKVIPTLVAAAPKGVPHVYLSSITAFGVPDFHHPLREYRFSRNMYGACKREGERLALAAARSTDRPGYVLRVGVVHGELQMVSRQTLQQVQRTSDVTTWIPDAPSFSVFAFSIAEALVGIVNGLEEPGRYTMLSNPAWSWRDVHEWYCKRAGVAPRIEMLGPDTSGGPLGSAVAKLAGPFKRAVFSAKDLISSYVSAASPGLENRLRGVYHLRTAEREIAEGRRASQYRPYGNNHTEFPGARPKSISDSRITMEPYAIQVRERLRSLTAPRTRATVGGFQ